MALSEFQKAFKAARAGGEKEFEFEGKKYNTKYKEESESSASSRPTASEPRSTSTPRESAIAAANDQTSPAPSPRKKEYYRSMSGKMVEKTPDSSSDDEDGGFLGKRMRAALGSSYKKGGSVRSSASSRADGIAQRGKTKGRIV